MRHLDAAGLGAVGAGEGSLFVTEQFAFEKRAGNRRAIYLYPRTGLPRRGGVDHAGDDVFAGATLSLDQHGDVGAGDLGQPLPQSPHGLGAAEYDGIGGHLAQGLD